MACASRSRCSGAADMDIIGNLMVGFAAAATAQNLFFCLAGCLLGTLIGVLPGIGPVATIAMLLPATYGLAPLTSLIMLAGIYYGAQYGGWATPPLVAHPARGRSCPPLGAPAP